VDRPQLVGCERAGVLDRPGRGQVELAAARTSTSSADRSRSYWRLSRSSTTTTSGMIGRITQASSKRVTTTTMAIVADSTAPIPLTTTPRTQPFSRLRTWWRVMPDCDRVNPVKTEMA
jgi:hypothetical protein